MTSNCAREYVEFQNSYVICQSRCANNDVKCICTTSTCKSVFDKVLSQSGCFHPSVTKNIPGYPTIPSGGKATFEATCSRYTSANSRTSGSGNSNSNSGDSNSSNIALIVGLVVGGVLFIVLTVGLIIFLSKRRKKAQNNANTVALGVLVDDNPGVIPQQSAYRQMPVQADKFVGANNPSSSVTEDQTATHSSHKSGGSNGLLLCDEEFLTLQLNQDQVITERKIGSGANGDVYVGKYNNIPVAIKKLSYELQRNSGRIKDFMEEITILSRLGHPRIVRCFGATWTNLQDLSAVMEFASNGDLRSVIMSKKDQGLFTGWVDEKVRIALDILEGLIYIHSMTIIHRDLKSRNVLIDKDYRAKLTDFGIARTREVWQESTMTGGVGTMFWMAPEVLSGSKMYNQMADIYSFGVILIELDTMELPYANASIPVMEIPFRVSRNELRPEPSSSCPTNIKKMIDMCLQFDDSKRPSAIELHHLWTSQDTIR